MKLSISILTDATLILKDAFIILGQRSKGSFLSASPHTLRCYRVQIFKVWQTLQTALQAFCHWTAFKRHAPHTRNKWEECAARSSPHILQNQSRHASRIQWPSGMTWLAAPCGPAAKRNKNALWLHSSVTGRSPLSVLSELFYARPLCFHDAGQRSGACGGDSAVMHPFDVLSRRPPNILCPTCHLG